MPSVTNKVEKGSRILFVVNDPRFFVTHRLALAKGVRQAGHTVCVAVPTRGFESAVQTIRAESFPVHDVPIERQGINPARDLAVFIKLIQLYRSLKPDIVHHVTIKPVLYGSLAARIAGVPAVVNAISGLGRLFATHSFTSRVRVAAVRSAYRLVMRHPNMRVIFQTEDDRAAFVNAGIVEDQASEIICGSGTDLNLFDPAAAPEVPPIVLLPARLLRQKGVREFVEAAQALRAQDSDIRFVIAGDTASNRDAIGARELGEWRRKGIVELWGWVDDMPATMRRAAIVCLPSYHEGVPKALIDACAAGRAIVATDIAGCRAVVTNGLNGFLVPPKDSGSLARALSALIADKALCERMGLNGRAIAEERFDISAVIRSTLEVYRSLSWNTARKASPEILS